MYGQMKAQKTTLLISLCTILSVYNYLTLIIVNFVYYMVKFA